MTTGDIAIRTRRVIVLTIALALGAVGAGSLAAQTVRGTVVRPDGVTPAGGVVALLLRASNDSVVGRAVTATRGAYQLRAPAAGDYRLRLLRLGHQPETVGPFALRDNETIVRDVVLVDRPIVLARFDVQRKDECRTRPDSGKLVAQLLGEARKALLASVATSLDGESTSEYQLYSRSEDTRGRLVAPEQTRRMTRSSARPFNSLPPDSLAKVGYVVADGDSVVYHGPDAEVLLSDAFAAGHCFGAVEGSGSHDGSIGVTFRPVAKPGGLVDIRGTIWMERATGMLQSVEYTYDPLAGDERGAGVGGEVEFWRTESGLWIVRRWNIRMPRRVFRLATGLPSTIAPPARVLVGVQRSGGDVISVRVGDVLHYQRLLAPSVITSAASVPEDAVTSAVTEHPVCGAIGSARDSGAVQGRVTADGGQGVAGASVIARWRDAALANGGALVTYRDHERQAKTVTGGDYVMCGLPLARAITLFVTRDGSRSPPTSLRLTGDAPLATSNLRFAQAGASLAADAPAADSMRATLRLRVRLDDGRGVSDAEVTVRVQSVTRTARSDSTGVAYFVDLPAGVAEIGIRRVGSAAKSIRTPVEPGRNEVSVQLAGSAVVLDAVRVIGDRPVIARHAEVDERIMRGEPNAVVTRRDIEKRGPIALSQMLRGMAGLRLADSLGSTVAISTRGMKLERDGQMYPCVMRVMVDGIILSASNSIDNVMPNDVYAVEVYYGAARVPLQFAGIRTDAWCGLVAIWSR